MQAVVGILEAGMAGRKRSRHDLEPAPAVRSPRRAVAQDALLTAVRADDAAAVTAALAAGADVDACDVAGWTPLMHAAAAPAMQSLSTLIAAGADANAATRYGFTALMFAARRALPASPLVPLLACGANPCAHSVDGWTAVAEAATAPDALSVRQLLRAGADAHALTMGAASREYIVPCGRGDGDVAVSLVVRTLLAAGVSPLAIAVQLR